MNDEKLCYFEIPDMKKMLTDSKSSHISQKNFNIILAIREKLYDMENDYTLEVK